MNLRYLTASDTPQVYDAFRSASVSEAQGRDRKSGFYEYPLSEVDIKERLSLSRDLSIGLFNGRRKLLAYTLAYSSAHGKGLNDSVLQNVDFPENTLYVDQLFLKPSLPVFLAGRLADCLTELAQRQNFSGVVCAIPQKPWTNTASTRFALCRGFERQGFVSDGGIELGVFAKPLWKIPGTVRNFRIEINQGGKQ